MERYNLKVKDELFIRGLEVELTNMRHGKRSEVKGPIYLYEDELYSFIYLNDKEKLGNKGEVIIRGRITKIEKQVTRKVDCETIQPSYTSSTYRISPDDKTRGVNIRSTLKEENLYTLHVDCSSKYGSKTLKLELSRILDIGPVDQVWNVEDDSELIPRIPELTTWLEKPENKDDKSYISKEYNRPHPSIE